MGKKLKVGVMGCAAIADRMVIPAILESPYLELAFVASRDESKANAYAEKFGGKPIVGYDALLDQDIDMVYMPLPTGLHAEWGLKTLEAGKHLLLEKSLANNLNEARLLIDAAREKKLLLQENFMFAFHRQLIQIKEWLAQEKIGHIRCLRSSFGFPPFTNADNIRYQAQLGGGALLDSGAYTLKVAQLLLGEGVEVLASNLTLDQGKGVDIWGGIYLHDRLRGIPIETAFGFDQFYQCSLEIWGSKGKISADRIFTAGPGISPTLKLETAQGPEVVAVEPDNHFLNLLNDFAQTVSLGSFEPKYAEIFQQANLISQVRERAHWFTVP